MQKQENSGYKMCVRCVMDTTDPEIFFDENGICNHCREYDKYEKNYVVKGEEGEKKMNNLLRLLKKQGKNKKYDCMIGISGGVDSTYLAYKLKEWGLRPIAVHFDNGWDSELAAKNIKQIVSKLDIDLHTYVVDWEEFKDLQLSYLKASVIDIEIPTDHGFIGALYKTAAKNNIKYIISGHNYVTESVLPKAWIYNKDDAVNIKDIYSKYGSGKLKSFPAYTIKDKIYYLNILKIRMFSPLNYIGYNKEKAKDIIIKELGWVDYSGKHNESIFTRFYQGYILPEKFNVDKRKAHLSNLICSGQINREEALEELKKPVYAPDKLKEDKEYVIKKFDLTEAEFEKIMDRPIKKHTDFATNKKLYGLYMKSLIKLKPLSDLVKAIGYK